MNHASLYVPPLRLVKAESHIITFFPEHNFSGDMSEKWIRNGAQELSCYIENFAIKYHKGGR